MNSRLRLGLLLGVSVLFVLMGLVVAALGDWRLGLGNTIFFGLAAAVFAYQLRELSRFEGPAQLLTLKGGIPLQMSSQRRAFFTLVVFGAGASSVLIGFQRNPLLFALGAVLMLAALVVGVLMLLGVPKRQSLMFTPEGIHFLGGGAHCVLHFDNLAQLQAAEWNGQLIVLLQPINLAALLLTVPEAQREAAAKKFGQSLAYMRAPLTIWASQFGLEARSLMKTIERYVREPGTRSELKS